MEGAKGIGKKKENQISSEKHARGGRKTSPEKQKGAGERTEKRYVPISRKGEEQKNRETKIDGGKIEMRSFNVVQWKKSGWAGRGKWRNFTGGKMRKSKTGGGVKSVTQEFREEKKKGKG